MKLVSLLEGASGYVTESKGTRYTQESAYNMKIM